MGQPWAHQSSFSPCSWKVYLTRDPPPPVIDVLYWYFPLCPSYSPLHAYLPFPMATASTVFLEDCFFLEYLIVPSYHPWCIQITTIYYNPFNCILDMYAIVDCVATTFVETAVFWYISLGILSNRIRVFIPTSLNFMVAHSIKIFSREVFKRM